MEIYTVLQSIKYVRIVESSSLHRSASFTLLPSSKEKIKRTINLNKSYFVTDTPVSFRRTFLSSIRTLAVLWRRNSLALHKEEIQTINHLKIIEIASIGNVQLKFGVVITFIVWVMLNLSVKIKYGKTESHTTQLLAFCV